MLSFWRRVPVSGDASKGLGGFIIICSMRAAPSGTSHPHFLWILPKWPLPATDGARVASVNLLRGLGGLGATIDVVAVAERAGDLDPEALKEIHGVSSVQIVRREAAGRGFQFLGMLAALKSFCLKPWLPVTLAPFASRSVREELAAILSRGPGAGGPWTAVVYDGLHPAAHSSGFGEFLAPDPRLPVYYRAHNVEAEIWRRKALLTRFPPLRLFLRLQAFLMRRFETSVVRAASAVLSVSEKDFDLFRSAVPGVKGGVVPIGYDFVEPAAAAPPGDFLRLLFLAKLDWLPNRDGLIWFLDHVWKEAKKRRPDLELWIAGSGDSGWLAGRADSPGIRFFGRVEKVDELYRDCAVSIVPIFYGSGTRVKAIESSRYSRPCLSTEIGVEGLGLTAGSTYFKAETAEEWISALARLDRPEAQAVGARARDFLKNEFHLPVAAQKFLDRITPCARPSTRP
jgi:glycosyltransferase involved in cell wall biosynthesis